MDRRSLIRMLLIFAAVVIAVIGISWPMGWLGKMGKQSDPVAPAGQGVIAYFGDLKDGSPVGKRWKLVHVYDVRNGTIPVIMATQDGTRYQVDLLRIDPAGPKGVAMTTSLALYLSNDPQSDGGAVTPEEQGLGMMELAAALTTRENAGAKPPKLSTLRERDTQFPNRQFAISKDE
jgi:hypothetical protein